MSFLHLSLLAGLGAISVPIVLHLFGQKQPQLIDFPTLRFVKETTQEQSTSWQLRHMLLLLLRILILSAMAFALARPRVHSALLGSVIGIGILTILAVLATVATIVAFATRRPISVWGVSLAVALSLWGSAGFWAYKSLADGPTVPAVDSSAPVAVAMIIDNGPTMSYKAENQVRLDLAKEFALWILGELPRESRVGVLTDAPVASLALDPATAEAQVKLIETRGAHIDLLARLRSALELVIANELERKEIYILTDLMSPAWQASDPQLKQLLDEYSEEVLVQIVDLGREDKSNWSLSDPNVDFETVPAGSDINFTVDVVRPTDGETNLPVTVELYQEEIDVNRPIIRNGDLLTAPSRVIDKRVVELGDEPRKQITLQAKNLIEGTHHFQIRMDKQDPLAIDNQRYVSITARAQTPTLIVADDTEFGKILGLIVDSNSGMTDQVRYEQLSQVDATQYSIICLYDPPPLSAKDAKLISDHVLGGGGLFLIMGPGLGSAASANGNAINQLLPGNGLKIIGRDRTNRTGFLNPVAPSHPVFAELANEEINWQEWPVFRSWQFDSLKPGVAELITLSIDDLPLMLVQEMGRGQIITLTTPVPQRDAQGDLLWNELWMGDTFWPSWATMLGTFRALSGADSESYNHAVGVPVSLSNDTQEWPSRYELFLPNAESLRVEAVDGALSLGGFDQAGTYRMRGVRGDPIVRGFSINAPEADTFLSRIDKSTLDEQLGANNFRVALNKEELESSVGQARFGRELYPLLMVLVAGLFLAEQAMANRFYKIRFTRAQGPAA